MATEKVKEVQEYLENRGIIVAETTIVNTAIDLVRRNGPGLYAFVCALERGKRDESTKRQ
jgi:transposase-like protein